MKYLFHRIRLRCLILTITLLSTPTSFCAPDFDWLRAAGAAYKAYKAYNITDEEVTAYVHQAVDYMDCTNKILPAGNPYAVRLKKLTSGLKKVDGVPLNFKVYDVKDEVNAFACADGSVRVYTSLMDLMTDDELMGVIGHEIGHVGKHHSRKEIKNTLLTDAFREVLASSSGTLGTLAASQLGSLGQVMINARYSRKQEKEADDYGYDFLKRCGKSPVAMIKALQKLQSLEKKSSSMSRYISKMFSSHPETEERISRLKVRCKKDGYPVK